MPLAVGVVGGGRMGSGIAHAFLIGGSLVRIVEADAAAGDRARAAVEKAVRASAERGNLVAGAKEAIGRLQIVRTPADLRAADLVVEAVPEEPEIKHAVLTAISAAVRPDAVVATNTSSLSVTDLATAITGPERFLGMHFFNPVPASKLIEVVVGQQTDPAVLEQAQKWVAGLGKTAVTVTDSPGFASSRLGVAIGLEAIRMLQDGVGSAQDIDTAMTLGYGHPMGPLKLTDLVGLDVRLGIAEYLHRMLGERFTPPQLLRDKVERGELGRKTGQGFYRWDD
ncbi:3-hydroxyacyl-CoA dehydrogenase family protein [Nakamurella sp. A5-74]|uniref:3-hydroxyacyl-CoA dehydrogenase family protein n=1 Tax=Nakamurella sp. A5-74 TaxID=3158264 RepID=A0AAU8DW50_9ACTN